MRMLCCLGIVAGFAAGSVLGGPWTFLAPVKGFGLGLIGDMMMIRRGLRSIRSNAEKWMHRRKQLLSGSAIQDFGDA